jgi:hypothetical protein
MTPIGAGIFDVATATAPIGDGRWSGLIHDGWDIGGNANGGYLLALAASALRDLAGRPDPVTITAHYLAPGQPGPVEISGEVIKSGKRFATVSGTMRSGDRPIMQVLAMFGDLSGGAGSASGAEASDGGYRSIVGGPPDLPPIDECHRRRASDDIAVPLMDRIDVRLRPLDAAYRDGSPTGVAEMAGYFGFVDGRDVDTLGLLLAADALPPAVFNLDIAPGWVPTVELTVHIRARPASGPLRSVFRSRFVHSGMLEEDGELWDSAGTLVALSRQLALLPR